MVRFPASPSLRFFIPTRDSAKWIGIFLDQFRKIGIEPLYICDTRSRDDTIAILQRAGADVVTFTPMADFAEAGFVSFGAHAAGTERVFRLDDDEFPSKALLEWIATDGLKSPSPAIHISRRELFRHGGKVFYSRSPGRFGHAERTDFLHGQPRLFRPDCVEYIQLVHTPGFKEPIFLEFAPQEAFFVHCNCLLRGPAERLQKILTYEGLRPNSSWEVADEYLPELFDLAFHRAAEDGLDEFAPLLSRLPTPDTTPLQLTEQELTHAMTAVEGRKKRIQAIQASVIARFPSGYGNGPELAKEIPPLEQCVDLSELKLPQCADQITGFSFQEHWGRWTIGPSAMFRFAKALPRRFALEIKCHPFDPVAYRPIGIAVGQFKTTLHLRPGGPKIYSLNVDNPVLSDTITFDLPDAVSPASLGLSDDARQLGMGIAWLRIRPLPTSLDVLKAVCRPHFWRQWITRLRASGTTKSEPAALRR